MRLFLGRRKSFPLMIGLPVCTCLLAGAAFADSQTLPIHAVDPPALAVIVGPGDVKLPNGATIHVAEVRLTFAAPELHDRTENAKTPRNPVPPDADWDPWPTIPQNPPLIALSPRQDEHGTLILGGLFRSILPDSLVVTSADGSKTFQRDTDYKYNPDWAQIANLNDHLGKPGEGELHVKFQFAAQRLDLVQVDLHGKVSVKAGKAAMVCPALPAPDAASTALAGIYIAPWKQGAAFVITKEDIFPIEPVAAVQPVNPQALAGSIKKLAAGQVLKIAFVGDSVSLGAESGPWWDGLWTDKNAGFPSRVVVALRQKFPKATITPIAGFKGGIATPVAADIFEKTVAPEKPDVVIIELGLNDAGGPVGGRPTNPPEKYKTGIRDLIRKVKAAGGEVLLVTPFQPNPFLANHMAQRIPDYRQTLLDLAKEENVGCADVYTEWMNQAKHGVPPFSQLHNWINHPGPEGHKLIADVLRFFENDFSKNADQK